MRATPDPIFVRFTCAILSLTAAAAVGLPGRAALAVSAPPDCGFYGDGFLAGCEGLPVSNSKFAPATVGALTPDTNNAMKQPIANVPMIVTTNAPSTNAGPGAATSSTEPQEEKSCTGSYVDNGRWSYVHTAVDFSLAPSQDGCGCGGCTSDINTDLPGQLRHLAIRRIHRPVDDFQHSSFGPGTFLAQDAYLTLTDGQFFGGTLEATFYDPSVDSGGVAFDDSATTPGEVFGDGILNDDKTHLYKSLEVLDAAGGHINQLSTAAKAIVTAQTGERWIFEVIDIDESGPEGRIGRLIRKEDQNGNAEVVTYTFAANASDATLNFDRMQLWKINTLADAYGMKATLQYTNVQGNWCVSEIDLPETHKIFYSYTTSAGNNALMLSGITYPDNSTSSFNVSIDSTYQEVVMTFRDNGASTNQISKSVYLTQFFVQDLSNNFVMQQPNLVRRVVNGAGEMVYRNWENPDDPNVNFFWDAPSKLTRVTVDASGYPSEVARANQFFTPDMSPLDDVNVSYTVMETYGHDAQLAMTSRTRPDGFTKGFVRDAITRAVKQITMPGGRQSTAVYNALRRPTSIVDPAGVTHLFGYDGKGNLTSVTLASGKASQFTRGATYNNRGQILSETDSLGHVTTYTYDPIGTLHTVAEPKDNATDPTAPVTTFGYDAFARLTSVTDALGHRTSYAYDSRGRLQTVTYPDSSTAVTTYSPATNLVTNIKDRDGNNQTFSYDNASRVNTIVTAASKPEQSVHSIIYVSGTFRKDFEIEDGEYTYYSYDQWNRQIAVQLPTNGTQLLEVDTIWDNSDRRVAVSDRNSRYTFFAFDSNDRVKRAVRMLVTDAPPFAGGFFPTQATLAALARDTATNPRYVIEDESFNADGQPNVHVDVRGVTTKTFYDELGRTTETDKAFGTTVATKTQFRYDAQGNNTMIIRPRTFTAEGNNVDTFRDVMTYNGRNALSSTTIFGQYAGNTESTVTSRITYTLTGKVSQQTDGNGKVTTTKYDINDRPNEVDDPTGAATRTTYDANGSRLSVTDPLGHITTYVRDGRGRVTRITDPLNHITTIEYDDNLTDAKGIDAGGFAAGLGFVSGSSSDGYAVRTTDPTGVVSVKVYDRIMRERASWVGSEKSINTYDAPGSFSSTAGLIEESITDGVGNRSLISRDGNGAIREVRTAAGNATTATVDAFGHKVSEREPSGVGANYVYDELNRKKTETDTTGAVTTTAYDVENNVIKVTDASGRSVSYAYDGRSLKRAVTNELGKTTNSLYDGEGRETQMTDSEGKVTQYQYEERGLLKKQIYSDGTSFSQLFDAAKRPTSYTDPLNRTITFTFDAADRMTARNYPDGKNDTFQYDAGDRLQTAASGRYSNSVGRTYDALGRLQDETMNVDGLALKTSYQYLANDLVKKITYPDGQVVDQTYTSNRELNVAQLGGTTVATLSRDNAGRITKTAFGNALNQNVSFKSMDNEVNTIDTKNAGGTAFQSLQYAYDLDKRVTKETDLVDAASTQAFGYDAAGRLTSWTQGTASLSWSLSDTGDFKSVTRNGVVENRTHGNAHQIATIGANTLVTDADGNMTTDDQGRTLAWDFDRQLASTTLNGTTISYTYDALGRRLSKQVGAVKTLFISEGEGTSAHTLVEYDNKVAARAYVYGEYVDQVLMMKVGSTKYYFSANRNMSTEVVTNSSGAVVEKYRYDANGGWTILSPTGTVLTSSTIGNHVGYTGRYHDETGLVFFRTRYYSPRLGRFISRDRAFIDGPNLYFAYFAPGGMDPTGQWGFKSIFHAVAKTVKKVEGAVKEVGKKLTENKIAVEVMGGGKVEGSIGVCTGKLKGGFSAIYKVGVDVTVLGVTTFFGVSGSIGKEWEGRPFNGFGCGGDCDECCVPNSLVSNAPAGSSGLSFGASFGGLKPITSWSEKYGFTCDFGFSYNGCKTKIKLGCEIDGFMLIPALKGIKEAVDATAKIPYFKKIWHPLMEAPIGLEGEVAFCKGWYSSDPTTHVYGGNDYNKAYSDSIFEDGTITLSGQIKVGLAVGLQSDSSGGKKSSGVPLSVTANQNVSSASED